MTTVEVPEELTKYLDDIIETKDQFKEDFREFVFDYHPDQGGDGDIDFDKMTNLRDDIIDELENGIRLKSTRKQTLKPGLKIAFNLDWMFILIRLKTLMNTM